MFESAEFNIDADDEDGTATVVYAVPGFLEFFEKQEREKQKKRKEEIARHPWIAKCGHLTATWHHVEDGVTVMSLMPREHVRRIWTEQPERFGLTVCHHTPELNT